jgi:hypothetical protein
MLWENAERLLYRWHLLKQIALLAPANHKELPMDNKKR